MACELSGLRMKAGMGWGRGGGGRGRWRKERKRASGSTLRVGRAVRHEGLVARGARGRSGPLSRAPPLVCCTRLHTSRTTARRLNPCILRPPRQVSLATLLVDDQLARANSGCSVTYCAHDVRFHMTPCFHQLLAGGM